MPVSNYMNRNMKKFILKMFVFWTIIFVFAFSVSFFRIIITRSFSWHLPKEKHILFLGASHVAHGLDDSRTAEAINLAHDSERYLFTYVKLQYLLSQNSQIDTIFLECAPTDLWQHTDDKYYDLNEQSFFIPAYWPLINKYQMPFYHHNIIQFYNLVLTNIFKRDYYDNAKYLNLLGGFHDRKTNSNIMNKDSVKVNIENGLYGHTVNYSYLRKIIKLCRIYKVKLYLLYCPVYKPEYAYDQGYYYYTIMHKFSDVEFLDYSHMAFKDDERYDAHHLNYKGARIFTDSLKRRFSFH